MKGSILKKLVFLLIVIIGAVCMNYSYGEPVDNTGNNSQTFNATININFKDLDETKWEFDNYDELCGLKVYTETGELLEGVNYEYEWSNGQKGEGTTDSEGVVNIKPKDVSASTNVTVLFKNCTQRFVIEIPNDINNISSKQRVYSEDYNCQYWDQWYILAENKNGSANIDLYKLPPPAKVNIKFLHVDGSEWLLNGDNVSPVLTISNTKEIPQYQGKYNSGKNYMNSGGSIRFCGPSEFEDELMNGSSQLELTIYNVSDESKLNIEKYDRKTFSKVCINGVEHEFVESKNEEYIESVSLKQGETVNLEYYIAETATGTIGIESYDKSLSEDFVWNLHFDMNDEKNSNEDYTNVYWMIEGDNNKYKPTDKNGSYAFDIQIPFGKKVKLYNLPLNSMFRNGESFKHNQLDADNKISSYTQSPFSNKTVITYKGESVTYEMVKQLGVSKETYYTSKSGGNDNPVEVDTSGYLKDFNIMDGFEINWYIFRNSTKIMFQKDYEEAFDIEENNKQFHYRVKLVDPLTQKPLSGKIAYYIYSDKDQVADIVNDVKYATLDSEGYIDIYLKAGEYVKIGKTITDEEVISKKLRYRAMPLDKTYISSNAEELISVQYFNDLGMIPYGVEYTIEEVEDNYNSVVDKEGAEKGVSKIKYAGEYYIVGYSAKEYYEYLGGFKFINSRKTGSLTIQKVVEGKETDEKFKFNIKITDAAKQFPLEYKYVDENGDVGKINFVEGEKIIKDNIEYTEYTTIIELKSGQKIIINDLPAGAKYKVTEALESMEGYNSEMSGATGEIKADDSDVKSIVSCLNKEIIVEEDKKEEIEEDKKEEIEEDKKEEVEEEAKQENKKDESPKTGDAILLITSVLAVSIIVFMITSIKIKKKNK